MGGITNPLHLAFIAVIALIFLGPKRLPDLARTLGNGMREFREAIGGESAHQPREPSVGIDALAPAAAPVTTDTAPAPSPSAPAPAPTDQVVTATATATVAAPSPSEQELAAPPASTAS